MSYLEESNKKGEREQREEGGGRREEGGGRREEGGGRREEGGGRREEGGEKRGDEWDAGERSGERRG